MNDVMEFPVIQCDVLKDKIQASHRRMKLMRIRKEIQDNPDTYLIKCSRCGSRDDPNEMIVPDWRITTNKVCVSCYNILKKTRIK